MLYIPGAPSATPTQVGNALGAVHTEGFKGTEAQSRDPFEAGLIEMALTRGIPVLAVCAGSWRLLESFGGQVRELNAAEIATHHRLMRHSEAETAEASKPGEDGKKPSVWDLNHDLTVKRGPGGAVRAAANKGAIAAGAPHVENGGAAARTRVEGGDISLSGMNSTHWAVADTDRAGKLKQQQEEAWRRKHGDQPLRNPQKLLEIVATEAGTGSVEGFETVHGAPIVGAQWHPEGYLDGMEGAGASYATDANRNFNSELFRYLILAAATASQRRVGVVDQLRKISSGEERGPALNSPGETSYRDAPNLAMVKEGWSLKRVPPSGR